jgi:hypothetical protein
MDGEWLTVNPASGAGPEETRDSLMHITSKAQLRLRLSVKNVCALFCFLALPIPNFTVSCVLCYVFEDAIEAPTQSCYRTTKRNLRRSTLM